MFLASKRTPPMSAQSHLRRLVGAVDYPFAAPGCAAALLQLNSLALWSAYWVEHHYVDGALASTEPWSAILTVIVQTPTDAEKLKKNPLGVYVHALNWSKELG